MMLIEFEERIPSWVLDQQTREVGLRGVAVARAVLQQSGKTSATPSSDVKKIKVATRL
ncbi:MAG: hypothetical protein M1305_02840 [Candidatus Marsarchaeota archaeon]|nr:hypothetical protein [Candidatus Marsarchaeota archaeon]